MRYLMALIFGLFLWTLHPSITAGDSAEISAAAFYQGIPHPPGYPLYMIISKLFTLALPFGNIAYRVNLVSAVFGTLSCLMVYLISVRVCLRSHISGSAAGAFAVLFLSLSYEFWRRSTVAEVYTLNAFLMLLIIYILLLWGGQGLRPTVGDVTGSIKAPPPRLLYLVSFILGLGIGNHHTIVLLVPGVLTFILWTLFSEVKYNKIAAIGHGSGLVINASMAVFFFVLGISVYLYLPTRSIKDPFMDWGNPQSLGTFLDVFTRRAYLPESVERSWARLIEQIRTFDPIYEFTPIGFSAGLLGILWFFWNADRKSWVMLLFTLIFTGYGLVLLAGGGGGDMKLLKKFYLPSYAVFSIFLGVGMTHAAERLGSGILRHLMFVMFAVCIIWQWTSHYPWTQNSENYLAYDYGVNELNSLPEGSVYISKGEIKTFPLWYLQGVEKYREDANVITAYFLTQAWHLPEVLKFVGVPQEIPSGLTYKQLLIDTIYRRNAEKGVYTGFFNGEYIPDDLLTFSQGITFRIYTRAEEKRRMDVWQLYRDRGVTKIEEKMDRGIVEILKDYASSHYNEGLEQFEAGNLDAAITEFERAVAINPNDPDSLHNLAALYSERGIKMNQAEEMAKKAFDLYTGNKDKEMARETIEEILNKGKGRGKA